MLLTPVPSPPLFSLKVENHGVLLPHSVATVKIGLGNGDGMTKQKNETQTGATRELAKRSRALVRLLVEAGGGLGTHGHQDDAHRWLQDRPEELPDPSSASAMRGERSGAMSRRAELSSAKGALLCALTLVREGDRWAGAETVRTHVEGAGSFEFYGVGCVCRVLQVRVDRGRREATLAIEGLARARVKSVTASSALVMGHCVWPRPDPSRHGPSMRDIRRLAEALYSVQKGILKAQGVPSDGLGKLTKSLWQLAAKSDASEVPMWKAQSWATQVSDLLLASPLLDKLMSRTQRLEALLVTSPGDRVRTFTSILQQKCSDHEALQLLRSMEKGGDGGAAGTAVAAGRARSGSAEDADEWDELEQKLENNLPKDSKVYREAKREFRRVKDASAYKNMPPQPGDNMMRKWLECVADVPWLPSSTAGNGAEGPGSQHVLLRAISVMDERHYGLKPVKRRIVQYLAVQQLLSQARSKGEGGGKGARSPVVLCLVGPPGVGKTSLARTIAESLDRPLQRVSLGGVRDEAEVRGHRRTYIGAMPGRVVQALIQSKTSSPVLLLDEMDKAGGADGGLSVRGDPLGALLEVLDPEQNHSFVDHYVGHPIDLSDVFFIATANSLDTMPPALRDRLEIVRLQAYTPQEKAAIGVRHLWPKALSRHGLAGGRVEGEFEISELKPEVVEHVAESYTREAGVRQLERCLASICRHIATKVALEAERKAKGAAEKDAKGTLTFEVGHELVNKVLGEPKVASTSRRHLARRMQTPGVAAGLAWTSSGVGTVQLVECCSMSLTAVAAAGVEAEGADNGRVGRLTLTGQLGEVLEESAQIALTWSRSQLTASTPRRARRAATREDVHVHLPAGSVPKDGPSAGVTIAVALTSCFHGKVRFCQSPPHPPLSPSYFLFADPYTLSLYLSCRGDCGSFAGLTRR